MSFEKIYIPFECNIMTPNRDKEIIAKINK